MVPQSLQQRLELFLERARDVGALLSPVQFKAVRESQEAKMFFLLRICGFFLGAVGMTGHGRELGGAYDEQIELVGFRALLY